MKNRQMLDIMNLVDDKYISEADPSKSSTISYNAPSRFRWSTFFAIAACIMLMLNIAIFVPLLTKNDPTVPPASSDSGASGGSGLNQVQNPSDNQNSEDEDPSGGTNIVGNSALISALDKFFASGKDTGIADTVKEENSLTGIGAENGVLRGDLFARTDKYAFYLKNYELSVYQISNDELTLSSILPLNGYIAELTDFAKGISQGESSRSKSNNFAYSMGWEMYISPDEKSLYIILFPEYYSITGVLTLDLERSPTIKERSFKMFSGSYVTSRMVNSELLLFTRYKIYKGYNKEKLTAYMPFFTENDKVSIAENIYFPNELTTSSYLTVSKLDTKKDTVSSSGSYLSFGSGVYVSKDNIYLTRTERVGDLQIDYLIPPYNTHISVINYSSGSLSYKGSITVNGTIKNHLCFNEKDGTLNLVTNSFDTKGGADYPLYDTSVSIYCIDINNMKILSSKEHFASLGEVLHSVSFDGTTAYICTSKNGVLLNPVFVFDLSDPENITEKDSITADRYSSAILDFGNGYLIGLGTGYSSQILKLEVYKRDGGKITSVYSYELKNVYFPTSCQAFGINKSKNLIGFSARVHDQESGYVDRFICLRFNGESLEPLISEEISYFEKDAARVFFEGDICYVLSDNASIYSYELK